MTASTSASLAQFQASDDGRKAGSFGTGRKTGIAGETADHIKRERDRAGLEERDLVFRRAPHFPLEAQRLIEACGARHVGDAESDQTDMGVGHL